MLQITILLGFLKIRLYTGLWPEKMATVIYFTRCNRWISDWYSAYTVTTVICRNTGCNLPISFVNYEYDSAIFLKSWLSLGYRFAASRITFDRNRAHRAHVPRQGPSLTTTTTFTLLYLDHLGMHAGSPRLSTAGISLVSNAQIQ